MNKKNKQTFILIDANSLFHRAYHALPRLTTNKGELVNAVYGFVLVYMRALKELNPTHVAAAFDVAGTTFREKEFEDYKAGRQKAPDDLYTQIPRIKEVLNVFNTPIYEKEGFEADDVIGTIAKKLEKEKNVHVIIVSGDLDTLQLVTKKTHVYTMKKSVQDTVVYDEKAVVERFGIKPPQLIDYKGLRGDPSDNIPGVPGVGEKTASQLIKKFSNLEKLYESLESNKKDKTITARIENILIENKEQAFFSRMLATIRTDVPISFDIKDAEWGGFNQKKVEDLLTELSFNRLIDRLPELEGFKETKPKQKTKNNLTKREEELMREVEEAYSSGILSEEIYKLEKDLVPVFYKMEKRGIKIDKNALKKTQKSIEQDIKKTKEKIFKEAGEEFNISSPKQLSEILFEKLKLEPKGLKKTSTKAVSTAAGELEKLREKHNIIHLVLEYRELQKLLTTYLIPLQKQTDEKNILHTTFKPLGTSTGRISSTKPNLQNIPIRGEFANKLRKAFVAKENKVFLACDYSQMELRIAAHLSGDNNMTKAFREGKDIHTQTASLVFNVKLEDVTKGMRYQAKALNFGLIYGIGQKAFAESAGIPQEDASDFIERYMETFEGIAKYMQETKEKAHKLGYVETMFGRKRFLSDINSPNPMLRAMAERAAINMPVQGTMADIVKMAMREAEKELPELELVLQIHDELLWEAEPKTVKQQTDKAISLLKNIVKLNVPLEVEYVVGRSWGDLEK